MSNHGEQALRRPFLRHLAYLCDYEKGGDTTTAIALQQTPQNIVYWFASNKCPNKEAGMADKTKRFLEEVLGSLKSLKSDAAEGVASELFDKAVAFSSRRIEDYVKILGREVDFVLHRLEQFDLQKDNAFWADLRAIREAFCEPIKICRMCYNMNSKFYETLQLKAVSGQPLAERFGTICHIIGRLNHTLKAVKLVVKTALLQPQLFDDFQVSRATSDPRSPPPLRGRNPTPSEIAGRMVSSPGSIVSLREALRDLDQKFGIASELRRQCAASTWRPRVHAELTLLNHFWAQNLEFVDADRYIGCSKPACYCCYHYIQAHPGRFILPPSHNSIYLNWKAPDIYDATDEKKIKTREDVLNEMAKKIRIEVLAQIVEKRGPASWRPDSLTEISTVRFRACFRSAKDPETNIWIDEGSSETLNEDGELEDRLERQGEGESEIESEDDEGGGVPLVSLRD
ncbi:hypothetical protein LSUE1_G005846 [Lachnellula suecica]|uniref:Uncharacterized protein n=1 Tax=Lachnellula suecica TaxID=602035 RepID=A0A8T9CD34_9HELO|nr:hypothetical protein LSUE1_G005846 [Lachnellula suecica]